MAADGIGVQELSPAGMARRAAMLRELDAAMGRRNLGRAGVRVCAVAAPLLTIVCIVWLWPRSTGSPQIPGPVISGTITATASPPAGGQFRFIRFVETDAGVLDRLAAGPVASEVRTISDQELQSILASLGRETGFVRTGGRVILVTDIQPPRPAPAPDGFDGHSSI